MKNDSYIVAIFSKITANYWKDSKGYLNGYINQGSKIN